MNGQEDLDKLGFSHSGLVARSPEGHAARGMAIKGEENLWVGVQKKTFTNWVNEQLRQVGMEVTDLQYDLCDGLKLVALIEVLQKRKLKKIAKPINHHQFLENVQTALNAITKDGIKLVNIGNTDIVDGNLKLILGLIWSLIVHYQIGRSRFPPKKLMLAWLKAALPKNNITNLTSSWNSGINLCALLNYCKPSLFPDWQNMDPNDKINNCHEAMRAAKKEFNIPMILTPDDLASRNLDELSGMTYLSYFMRPESPGYFSSLNWIRKQVPHLDVRNFTTDWNDGITLCHLSRSLGAPIKGFSNLNKNQKYWEHNQELGIKAGKHLGVESILTAKEMTEKEVDYLGIMAYASAFQWVSPQKPAGQRISITGTDLNNCHVNKKAHFKINLLDVKVDVKRIRVDIKGPSRDVKCALDLAKSGCSGEFTPFEDGTHELIVYYDDEVVEGCPMNVKVHPDLSKIMFSGIDPCAIGSIVEVLINSKGAGGGAVRVDATAPSDKIKSCPVSEEKKGIYMAKFSPNEIGEWKIAVTYSGQHIHGSPFTCYVYDPAKVKLIGLDPGLVNEDLRFVADANQAGWGDIKIEVSHAGRDVPCQVDERGNGEYRVIFRPRKVGRHKVHVTYNGIQVKGSPFGVEVFDNRESLQVYHERNKHKFSSSLKVDRNKFETTSKDKIDLEGRSNFDFSNQRRFEINRADNIDGESRNGYSFTKNGFTESKWSSEFSHSQHDSNKVQIRKQAISDTKPNRHYFGFNSDNDQNSTDEYVAKPPEVKPKPTNYVSRDDYHGNSQGKGQFQEIKTKATDYRSRQRFPSDIKGHRHDSFSPSREDREPTRTNSGLNSSHSALFGNSKNERTHFRSKYNLIEDSDHENKQPKYPFQSDIMKHKRDSSVDNREPSIKSKTESVLNQARSPRNQMNMLMQDELKLRSQEFRLRNEERLASEKTEIDASVRSGYKIPTNLDKIRISGEEDLKLLRVRTTGELMLHGDLSLQPEDIKVIISAPNMKQLPVNIYSKGPSMYKIEFVPLEVGEHIVELFIQGNRMESNIKCFVFDSDKIKVGHIPNGVVGKSIEFEIDGSNAGSGNLEILVNGGHVTSQVRNLGNHKFLASFIPHSAMTHSIEMKFNGRPVPGSPWSCEIRDSSSNIAIRGEGIKSFSCERPTSFDIIASDCKKDDFEVIISTPSNKRVKHRLLERPGNRFSVEFRSAEVGIHTIDIALNRQEISGSPFLSKAYNASLITVSPIDEILLNEIYEFTVDASLAGEGQLEISINDGEVPNEVQVVGGGKCIVMFTPELAETHKVDIHFNGESVPGSPFICRVVESFSKNQNSHFSHESKGHFRNRIKQTYSPGSSVSSEQISIAQDSSENSSFVSHLKQDTLEFDILDERGKFDEKNLDTSISSLPSSIESSGSKRTFPKISISNSNVDLIPVGRLATFDIHFDQGCEINLLNVTIKTPSNKKLPVKIANLGKTGFSAEFTPKEVGPHDVTVEYGNLIVSGSPFTSNVFDAKKVLIGDIPNGTLNDPLKFSVDASRCGEGNLEITVTADENNVATEVDPLGNAKFMVSFIPIFDCDHIIDVSFNEHRVPGSPFCSRLLKAENNDSNQSSSSFNKTSSFTISNISGNISDFDVKVLDPKENTIAAEIKQNLNGLYKVDFLPRMTGEYKIMVDLHGSPVSGSPFVCKVYDAGQIKVRDIPKGYVGKPVTFLVETESAGPGNLEVSIDGGQVPTTARTQAPNLYAITFTPEDKHLHIIDLKFNGEPVPDNPFTCSVMESPPKVSVSGDGLEKVAVNRPASFIVDPSRSEDLQLLVNILSPTRQNVPVHINGSSESLFRVEYTPTEVGDHTIEVTYGDMVVTGSPFLVKAYDPAKVKVTDVSNGTVGKPVYFSIDASQAGAGNLEIIVSVNGRNVPNYVQSEGNAKFRVHFKPTEVQQHILSVKFNGEPVPGSPYFCQITDTSSNYVVSGASLRIASVLKESKFTIDTRGVSKTDSKILITAPSGKLLPSNVEKNDDKFDISFTPVEVGPHMIIVTLDGESVSGSPFTCNVYDVNKINITGLNPTEVGKPITFQVDASQAGEGTLELVVTTQKTSVRAEVAAKSRGLYDVTFTPQDITPHFVNITFNDEKVPGAPFKCDVLNESNDSPKSVIARGEGLKQGLVGAPGIFEIDAQGLEGKLDIRVVGPGEAETPSSVSKTPIGTYKAEYNAKEVGTYKIEVYHGSKAISSKPFLVEVCDPSRVKVLDIKDGLQGHEQSFRVDTTRAGRGHLEAKITSSSGQEVKSMIREIGNGHHEVLWTPVFALPHKINVTYNSHSAPGCPIDVSIKDSSHSVVAMGTCLRTSSATKPSTFVINTKGFGDAKDIDVIITGPKDSAIPVKCYQQNDGNLLAEFTPINTGAHKIEILHENKPIPGSPYLSQVFDASKIKIQKLASTSYKVHQTIAFSMSRKDAGYAELDVTVTSPLGKNLPFEVKGTPDGEGERIEFTPTVAGKYKIAIKYGGNEVPGSPITFMVEEPGIPKVYGDGLISGMQDEAVTFKIDVQGLVGEPHVQVDGPDSVAKCTLEEESDGMYLVTYIPREVGLFDIRIFWNGKEVNGSPFHPKITNPSKVRVIGGLESLMDEQSRLELILGEEKRIPFDVSEAGPGRFRAEVRGPSGMIESLLEQTNVHRYKLSFTPTEEGEFFIYLYYADSALPRTPYVGYAKSIGSSPLDHTRVVLRGQGIVSARVSEEAEFIIDGSEAGPGSPEISMGGVKADITVTMVPQGNNVYRANYTPTISGSYLLNVMWSDRQVKGCPLKVSVTASADASKVICSGDGLRGGQYGKEIKSYIDTRRAGPGELTAQCVGPHKVAYCELYDHRDGTFTLYVKPQEGGRHVLTIKYGGEHVEGSPFNLRIAGPPDASKVRVYGPGIEPGVLATYQSRFISDTRGAGAGQLTVRIRGPKGAFRVEMQRESQKDRTILCKYDPTEPGDYRVEVKWSGEHVPGSPFLVMIFDTQDELNRYLQGPGNTATTPNPEYTKGNGAYGTSFGQMSWKGSQTLS